MFQVKMEVHAEVALIVLFSLVDWSLSANGAINYRCQACRAVVDETFFMIDKVDPKKTIQSGSFRVDSHGNQGRYEVPYARSETHLTEVFEEICTNLHNYGETVDDNNIPTIIRTTSKDLKTPVDISNIVIDPEKQRKLINICHNLIEDFEDDMMVVFKNKDVPNDMAEKMICVHKTEMCSEDDLQHPLPQPKPQTADSVVEEIKKRMSETEPQTARPIPENEQMDDNSPDKTEL